MDTLAGAETLLPVLNPTGRSFARLDQAERAWLGALLRPLPWLDGLMTAETIAPIEADNPDDSEAWLDHIWRKDSAAELSKLTPVETGNIVSELMGQYGHIGNMLRDQPEAYRPYLSGDGDPLDAAAQWAGGFRRGMRLGLYAWTPLLSDQQALNLATAIFGLLPDEDIPANLAPESPFRHMSADERADFRRETVEMLPQIVLTLRDYALDLDEANAEYAGPYVRATPKVGRNDPCPCGSGKKYKKCCLDRE